MHIPTELDQQQDSFFDGIRYSVEMADLASIRLSESLWRICTVNQESPLAHVDVVSSFLDAWSMVDSIHRLSELLEQMPGLRKRRQSPLYRRFMQEAAIVEKLRNVVQHLRGEIHEMARNGCPIWGSIQWLAVLDSQSEFCRCCAMTAGRIISGSQNIINPCDKVIQGCVDFITLQCKSLRLDLSETMRLVERIVVCLEKSLARQFNGLPSTGSEIIVRLDIQLSLAKEMQANPTQELENDSTTDSSGENDA
jgi:hypothetical protein